MATNVLIVFYSRNGSAEALANAVAEGAREAGAEVRVRRVRDTVSAETMALAPGWAETSARMQAQYEAPTTDDCEWADGIVFGAPTRFGIVASELKSFIDGLGGLWFGGKLLGKAGSVFSATATTHGGAETTILSMYSVLAHLGLIIVPNGYGDPITFQAGTPYGSHTAVDGQYVKAPHENDLTAARYQGKRVAAVAGALKTLRA